MMNLIFDAEITFNKSITQNILNDIARFGFKQEFKIKLYTELFENR